MKRDDGKAEVAYDGGYSEVRNPYEGPKVRRLPLSPDDWRNCIVIDHFALSQCESEDGALESLLIMGSPLTECGFFMSMRADVLRSTAAAFLRMADEAEGVARAD